MMGNKGSANLGVFIGFGGANSLGQLFAGGWGVGESWAAKKQCGKNR
jgi:hypothetical protein